MKLLQLVLAVSIGPAVALAQNQKLLVHEWGTFTSLQDEAGRTLGGINSEDEPLPRFTHDIDHLLVLKKNNLVTPPLNQFFRAR